MELKESYAAASNFPGKLLHQQVVKDGKIMPIHIQLILTNACNLDCAFCSCSDRDQKNELAREQISDILTLCSERGTKAMTITGGGEPLMHKEINEVIRDGKRLGIKTGLVTNGILLKKIEHHENLVWCRISSSDDRTPDYSQIEYAMKLNPQTNWAFSHVVTKNPNYQIINELVSFANEKDFSHVRLVSDLHDLDNVPNMGEIKSNISVDDSRVIYQDRKDSTKGSKDCYISLLKPVICPEGVFPCCGVQYAINGTKKDMNDALKMGDLKSLNKIFEKQLFFDGSVCNRCYYGSYNSFLEKLLNKPNHLEFV